MIQITTTGSHRFRDAHGREWALGEWLARRVAAGGQQWKGRGAVLKGAGWRPVGIVASWGRGEREPLVVITDGAARWPLLDTCARRFWIELGFRCDTTRGWQWEQSQVLGLAHHAVLLLAMAWASLPALCLGVAEARAALRRLAARPLRGVPPHPRHARDSIFTLALRAMRTPLYYRRQRPVCWRLPEIAALSWSDRWRQAQADRVFSQTVRP